MKFRKNILLYFGLILSCSGLPAMEKPSELNKSIEAILASQLSLSHNDSIKIEQDFGQQFDYKSFLRPDDNVTEAIYKRRLKQFKRYLFNYIKGQTRPTQNSNEISGGIISFLSIYYMAAETLKKTASAIPFLGSQPIVNFIPESVMRDGYFKIPIKDNSPVAVNPILVPDNISLENGQKFWTFNGLSPIIPINQKIVGKNYEYAPFNLKSKEGTIISILPYVARENGKTIVGTKVPVCLCKGPETESICIALAQLNMKNAPIKEKCEMVATFLAKENLCAESKRIIDCFLYNLSGEALDDIIKRYKANEEFKPDDKKSLQDCCFNCPHLLKLEVLQKRLLRVPRNFLNQKTNGEIIFTPDFSSLFDDVKKYVMAMDILTAEYNVIYQRINKEIKAFKNKLAKKEHLEIKEETAQPVQVFENPTPQKIKYSKRVMKWFNDSFVKAKKESSIFYHTILPTIADKFVIRHGEKSEYYNKTYKGQKDDHYTIAGKILNNETKEESYCRFNVCLDPKGICYHRDCKKCTWEELPLELKKGCDVVDVVYEDGNEEFADAIEAEEPKVLREADTYISILSPMHKCTITLFKKLL